MISRAGIDKLFLTSPWKKKKKQEENVFFPKKKDYLVTYCDSAVILTD